MKAAEKEGGSRKMNDIKFTYKELNALNDFVPGVDCELGRGNWTAVRGQKLVSSTLIQVQAGDLHGLEQKRRTRNETRTRHATKRVEGSARGT